MASFFSNNTFNIMNILLILVRINAVDWKYFPLTMIYTGFYGWQVVKSFLLYILTHPFKVIIIEAIIITLGYIQIYLEEHYPIKKPISQSRLLNVLHIKKKPPLIEPIPKDSFEKFKNNLLQNYTMYMKLGILGISNLLLFTTFPNVVKALDCK